MESLMSLWYVYAELREQVQDLHMCLASGTISFPCSFSTNLTVSGRDEAAIISDNGMMAQTWNIVPSDYISALNLGCFVCTIIDVHVFYCITV